MRVFRALQLSVWLVGLCLAQRAPQVTQPVPLAPAGQVGVLSQGLLHLLSGMEENARHVGRQARWVVRRLDGHGRELLELRRRAARVDRIWTGLKRDLQVTTARGEGLQRGAWVLRKALDDQNTSSKTLEHRLSRVQENLQLLSAPGTADNTPLNITALQVTMDAQSRRLADLALEVMIQDGLMVQQELRIMALEEQVSDTREDLQASSSEDAY